MFGFTRGALLASYALLLTAPATQAANVSAGITTTIAHNGSTNVVTLVQGGGPTIVLLPSLGRDQSDFDMIAGRLDEAGFRVLRPQPRGLGGSSGPMTGLTLHDLAADVAAAIVADSEGKPKKVVLAGHAFGGFVARTLAADRPDLTRGLALIACSANADPLPAKVIEAIADGSNDRLAEDKRLAALKYVFFAPPNDPHVWLSNWDRDVMKQQLAALSVTPKAAYFTGGSVVPLLDVQPTEDLIVPLSDADVLKQELAPRVTVAIIPDAGHAVIAEQPAAVGKALIEWARRLPY